MSHGMAGEIAAESSEPNHPLAPRMCAIAFVSYNLTMGCFFGSFGVLVPAVEAKMGVNRELSTLGLPLVMAGLAALAPVAGVLATKLSIRLLLILATIAHVVAYSILGLSNSMTLNLAVYALLIGPAQAFSAIVLPSTLVTRWYNVNRGRALGLVAMPAVPIALPLILPWIVRTWGLGATYGLLAAAMALLLVPLMFVIDYPPGAVRPNAERAAATSSGLSVGELLARSRFWQLSIAAAAIIAAATVLSAHIVPMARDWGMSETLAASLIAVPPLAAMPGSVVFGWIADKLGGAGTLAVLCLATAVLWALMLLHPPYYPLLAIVALMGLTGGAIIPTFSLSLSQQFGRASFSRAFGVGYLVGLPFNFIAVPVAARVYDLTGSYAYAIVGLIVFQLVAMLLVMVVRRPAAAPA